jgi:hypothetical protein
MKRSHDLQSNEDHMAMALAAQHRGLQVGAICKLQNSNFSNSIFEVSRRQ